MSSRTDRCSGEERERVAVDFFGFARELHAPWGSTACGPGLARERYPIVTTG